MPKSNPGNYRTRRIGVYCKRTGLGHNEVYQVITPVGSCPPIPRSLASVSHEIPQRCHAVRYLVRVPGAIPENTADNLSCPIVRSINFGGKFRTCESNGIPLHVLVLNRTVGYYENGFGSPVKYGGQDQQGTGVGP